MEVSFYKGCTIFNGQNLVSLWVNFLCQLASGEVFGPNQPIALKLLGSERSIQALEGKLPTCVLYEYAPVFGV